MNVSEYDALIEFVDSVFIIVNDIISTVCTYCIEEDDACYNK